MDAPRRHRVPRPGARGGSTGSALLRAPMFLAMIAFFGIGIVYHVYQFSVGLPAYAPLREPFYNVSMVQFTTKFGQFTMELYPNHAPQTVALFARLLNEGFYSENTGFYRNEPNFLLQGGGFLVDKTSKKHVPVEVSLPSTERMVILARSEKSDSGNSEFAVLLHDNLELGVQTDDSPGFTVFGRVVQGWHTIEYISKKMPEGFLSKNDQGRQVAFEKVEYVERLTNDNDEARKRLEELNYVLETKHTVNIFSELDCPDTAELKTIFSRLKASVRTEEIGYSPGHPYEHEALRALVGTSALPLVFINHELIGGLAEVKAMDAAGTLPTLLERSGALAEPIVWNAIHHFPLVVFSKSYCPYCKKAKEVLADLGAKPVVFELDQRADGAAMQDFLFRLTGQSTVPNVFIKGRSIGGSDKTVAMYKSGELKERLTRAGALTA
ncbi:hypothetical protein P43SY_002029 [Pythium insidiosum]|uniref:PPIase cyclophilin-type domain-containing protein n=1 Tax=Pythium insidiosum TaxID=114742 RepID=A0AAD5M6U8_PYTIN|nr:hypothetical protein P43SY_002029 [Pythium insidiosum]